MGTQRAQPGTGNDPVTVDGKHYKVEFENERVRVLRVSYGPNEKSVMHSHPALVAVFLTDQRSRFTYPDGRSEEVSGKTGEVKYFDPFTHLPENLSDTRFELIAIELKDAR